MKQRRETAERELTRVRMSTFPVCVAGRRREYRMEQGERGSAGTYARGAAAANRWHLSRPQCEYRSSSRPIHKAMVAAVCIAGGSCSKSSERTFLDHLPGSSSPLLRRLEDQAHCAIQGSFIGLQHLACAQEHGHMRVVAAGVHVAIVLQSMARL